MMGTTKEPILELKNVKTTFKVPKGILKAVNGVDLTIYKGETVGLVGESGCGKTTVGRTLLRLYEPTGGRIIYDDKVIFDAIYPRCYYMCKSKKEILSFIDKYEPKSMREMIAKLYNYDKVYLYMPTWRGNLNDDFIHEANFDFEKLNDILVKQNRLFILKLHPAVRILQNVNEKEYSNICFLDKRLDIYPLLPFVDILITDYSSIYYDFLLLNKGVLLYPFDKQRFIENSNDLAFDYDEYTPGKRVYSMTDFLSVIASDDILEIDGKDKMRILYAFWGKADKNRLDLLYDKIKTV